MNNPRTWSNCIPRTFHILYFICIICICIWLPLYQGINLIIIGKCSIANNLSRQRARNVHIRRGIFCLQRGLVCACWFTKYYILYWRDELIFLCNFNTFVVAYFPIIQVRFIVFNVSLHVFIDACKCNKFLIGKLYPNIIFWYCNWMRRITSIPSRSRAQ